MKCAIRNNVWQQHGRPAVERKCAYCGNTFATKSTRFFSCSVKCRLFSEVNVLTKGECWEWFGVKTKGYGEFFFNKQKYRTHRLAWEIHNCKPVPLGMVVRHSCDNPACCNPSHLSIGTHNDNVQDCKNRGRNNPRRGSNSPQALLNEDLIPHIRDDQRSARQIAAEYGVKPNTIYSIKSRKSWAHI